MQPTLTTLPTIAFSRNPIWLKLQSDDYRTGTPAVAVNYLDFTGAVAADDLLVLTWAKGAATITAATSPDDSGRQIPAGDGGDAYVTGLVAWFQGNYFIDRDFIVTVVTGGTYPRLVFTARNKGAEYTFPAVAVGSFSSGNTTPGVSYSVKPNFGHYVEVWVQNLAHTSYDRVYFAVVPLDGPDLTTSTIDLAYILHPYLSLDQPQPGGSVWQTCLGSCRNYYVKYAQYYGDDPSIQHMYTTGTNKIAYGGYSELALSQIANLVTYLPNYLLPDPSLYKFQRWLETWPVDNFTVKTNRPQFLYFINNRSVTETLRIKVDLTFSDNSTSTVYLDGGDLAPLDKIAIGCGYKQLNLQSYTTSLISVASYVVSLVESTTLEARSLPKYFTVDRDYEEYSRDFMYADSAGNFKTLHTYGKGIPAAKVASEQVVYQPNTATQAQSGNYANSNIQAVISNKVSTGYIEGTGAYDAVFELLLTKQFYQVFGLKLVPLVITSTDFDFSADGKNMNAFTLEYRLAANEQQYTADSYALPVPNILQPTQALNDL